MPSVWWVFVLLTHVFLLFFFLHQDVRSVVCYVLWYQLMQIYIHNSAAIALFVLQHPSAFVSTEPHEAFSDQVSLKFQNTIQLQIFIVCQKAGKSQLSLMHKTKQKNLMNKHARWLRHWVLKRSFGLRGYWAPCASACLYCMPFLPLTRGSALCAATC